MAYYILRPWGGRKFGTRYAYADILDPQITGDPRSYGACPVCGSGLGPRPWLPPHRIRLSKAVYPDFLWGAGFELMVSERFLSLYREAGLTGITHIDPPAEVVKIGRKRAEEVFPPPPAYHNVWYVHGGADLDDERSQVKRPPNLCGYCRQGVEQVLRVILREGSWTGADIFEAYGLPGSILVTERCKALIEEHALTNGQFVLAESYCVDFTRIPYQY